MISYYDIKYDIIVDIILCYYTSMIANFFFGNREIFFAVPRIFFWGIAKS